MTCLVVGDEPISLRRLVNDNLKKIPLLDLKGEFRNPMDALLYLQTHAVDIVFLDVSRPGVNGFEFMKIYRPDQRYILTTTDAEYAYESYEYIVIDYLKKPYSFDRFAKAIQKAQLLCTLREAHTQPDTCLYVKAHGRLQRIGFDQLCYIEAQRNYATIFRQTDSLSVKTTLQALEKQLPVTNFLRVHKSYIVALSKVEFVDKAQIGVTSAKGIRCITLSSQFKRMFQQAMATRCLLKSHE